jgi:hypothetical protein
MSPEKAEFSWLDICLQGIGLLACILVLQGFAKWQSRPIESKAMCLVAIVPAYIFVRDLRRLSLERLQYIFLWIAVVTLLRGFRYIRQGYVPLTGTSVSDGILYRVFGLALISCCCGGICFWVRSRQGK